MANPRSFFIVGPPGSGKSTLLASIKEKLTPTQVECVDLDVFIEDSTGKRPSDWLRACPEEDFRRQELICLASLIKGRPIHKLQIIALGGGTLIEQIELGGVGIVWLKTPLDLCWERISKEGALARPLVHKGQQWLEHRTLKQQQLWERHAIMSGTFQQCEDYLLRVCKGPGF